MEKGEGVEITVDSVVIDKQEQLLNSVLKLASSIVRFATRSLRRSTSW